jgi:hypothetical protein
LGFHKFVSFYVIVLRRGIDVLNLDSM